MAKLVKFISINGKFGKKGLYMRRKKVRKSRPEIKEKVDFLVLEANFHSKKPNVKISFKTSEKANFFRQTLP